jgi:putative ABC transport system permease protein
MMRLFSWFGRDRLDDISDEIRSHIEEKTDALIAGGMSRSDAQREARRVFGNVTAVTEAAGDVWRVSAVLESFTTDVRYVLRSLIKKPGYAIAVTLTLALGIGANAVVFALVNAVVLRPLPYPSADRLISLSTANDEGRDGRVLQDVVYEDWRQMTTSIESSAAYEGIQQILSSGGRPERFDGTVATASYFFILGVRPLLGRLYSESEAQSNTRVVVLSEQLWRSRFNADSGIVGRTVTLANKAWQVIGVLPAAFARGRPERFWQPLRVAPLRADRNAESGEFIGWSVVARIREGVSFDAVRAELATVFARNRGRGEGGGPRPVVMTLHERRHGDTRRPLLLLFGAVGVLLLTACANIANLGLARAARREREFALRRTLGASRARIVRFVLIESLALAAAGAALGLVLVRVSLAWFVSVSPSSIGNAAQAQSIYVNGELVAYTSAAALLTAIVFGLIPALTASRAPLTQTLAAGAAQSAGSRRHSLLRRGLVIGELAVALVFLTGAGLVAKTFWRVASADPGFRAEKLLAVNVELGDRRYTFATGAAFFDELKARVGQEPGVQAMSYVRGAPHTGKSAGTVTEMRLRPRPGEPRSISYTEVDVDSAYFKLIGAQLVAGRFIGSEDRRGGQRVAVVTEEFVKLNLGGAPALGYVLGGGKWRQWIVGVIKDISHSTPDGKNYPLFFKPLAQRLDGPDIYEADPIWQTLIVRTTGDPAKLEAAVRAMVESMDAALPPPEFTPMEQSLAEVVAPRKFTLVLLGAFAMLALVLAVLGLYSVLAYLVAERTREIGVRLALGADAARVMRMVLGEGMRLVVIGTLIGIASSVAAVRVLSAWMYEMSVYDAPTFAAVATLLCVVALIASWLPARRASRVDPVAALRAD